MPTPKATYRSDTEQRDPLIAGYSPIETAKYTLAAGTLSRGAIVGKVLNDTPVGTAAASNTGNGTIGTLSIGNGAKAGTYRVVCIEPGANVGTFAVEDPDGNILEKKAVVAVAYTGQINFTLTDGATDFIAGDSFSVVVAETTGVKKCVAAATDGSHRPFGIVVDDVDASAAACEVLVYTRGDFDQEQLTIGAGLTVAGAKEALRARGIFLVPVAGA